MEPQDDPEARIRELERPLADSAHSSELGGTQPPHGFSYPPGPPVPPLPPSYGYGDPFRGPSPKPRSGIRLWWILGAFFVVFMLALVGGIAALSAHRLSRGGLVILPPTPSISRGPSSPRTSPSGPAPSVSRTQTPSAGPSTPPPPAGNISISGVNQSRTIVCNDSMVSVSGVSNTVVITGHCASLTVSGVKNSVTVDSVDTIDASGFNNHVTYHSGSPNIDKSGDSNVVQQG
ncbi:hypothetical protein B586_00770 [Mycobacterium haemophilum DSM 44634]|uniref:DUF3060 domain-containing protein n=1 Tax=Mycobacterium haemophilum TaxID=29311 RepID=UPI000654C20E|nr:DUF3060 domain-containing protein [Mycobacterium haemophilum]AKN15417.1 hypothetical protein B586_00770 [Mycobacterium haemophilum DSM 44634]MCV7342301.1 DUF3060 domain-containing protein [Mycobacterium haemophilum DSM 44634]